MVINIETQSSEISGMRPWQRERRDRILQAALELLEVDDYDGIQVRDVAARAGFAPSTLYRYFSSKEHLYACVLREWASRFPDSLRRRPLSGPVPDRLKEVVRRVIRAFEHRRQFLRLEMVLETSDDADATAVMRGAGDESRRAFAEALPEIDPATADRIIDTVRSVLALQLRMFAVGHLSVAEVQERVDVAIDLIFAPAPS